MMIWTAKFSKIRICAAVALAAGIALAAFLAISALRGENLNLNHSNQDKTRIRLDTEEGRIAYLAELGWEVSPDPVESFRFLLPEPLTEPYLSYNALQLPQGFDLNQHTGQQITRYTYKILNYPNRPDGVQANLYIIDADPVAGDIFCPGANGFQEPLIRENQNQN